MVAQERELAEIFQLRFFQHLMDRIRDRTVSVKGGGCLRFFHNSPRLSEDIDFDIGSIRPDTLKRNVESVFQNQTFAQNLRSHGITNLDVTEKNPTRTSAKWTVRVHHQNGTVVPTKTEFSLRRSADQINPNKDTIDPSIQDQYDIQAFSGKYYDQPSMIKQKINALSDRSRWAIRDGFDIHFLLQNDVSIPSSIHPDQLDEAIQSIEQLGWDEFSGEVLPYLEDDVRFNYNSQKKFWDMLESVETKFLKALENDESNPNDESSINPTDPGGI